MEALINVIKLFIINLIRKRVQSEIEKLNKKLDKAEEKLKKLPPEEKE